MGSSTTSRHHRARLELLTAGPAGGIEIDLAEVPEAGAVVLLQLLWVLVTGEVNVRLNALGQSLAVYTSQMIRYLTYNTEQRPFPFDEDWP